MCAEMVMDSLPPIPAPPRGDGAAGPIFENAVVLDEEVIGLRHWLLDEARMMTEVDVMVGALADKLSGIGIPVDRISFGIQTLHAEHGAYSARWARGEASVTSVLVHSREAEEDYRSSPFYTIHQTRTLLSLWLPDTPDETYPIVQDLKRDGYTHYLCFPIFFANGNENGVTFATCSPEGFSPRAIARLQAMMPELTAELELRSVYRSLNEILRIYVGDEPHRAILSGAIQRGHVTPIRSSILFADMRGYTRLTSNMAPEDVVELLNIYFDCLVPPIEDEGGEVLKYMGDGLLAIFRDRGDDTGAASQSALTAAISGLRRLDALNARHGAAEPIRAGIALHHGEAAYGNVGSGARLDFTVVGRDVNLTSRLAQLNKVLDEPLLMSRAFADHLWANLHRIGNFRLDGFEEDIEVFRP